MTALKTPPFLHHSSGSIFHDILEYNIFCQFLNKISVCNKAPTTSYCLGFFMFLLPSERSVS